MSAERIAVVTSVLARAPEWIRADLGAKDPLRRQRAEEAIAVLIDQALAKQTGLG